MGDVIVFLSALQVTMLKKKDHAGNAFIAKRNYCPQSSDDGDPRSNSRRKIACIKGDHMLDKKSISKTLHLANVTESHRTTIDESIKCAFCARTSKGIAHCGRAECITRAVNENASSKSSRIEWERVLEKEGIEKKIYVTNLVA